MKAFPGFPDKMRLAALPELFFTQLVPHIDDLSEMKVTLHLLHALYSKRGYPRFVTGGQLQADRLLVRGVGGADGLRDGLRRAVSRGTILSLALERDGQPVELYFLNTESDRQALARIENGEIDVGALPRAEPCDESGQPPNIFALYEENIGMLTPMIAEQLKDAEQLYPASWLEDAIRQAVSRNKRNWRYIEAILKRWDSEGREDGKPGRDSKADRDKYIKGRYGHVVRR